MLKEPLISCLCVTRNKPRLLKRAIDYFIHQTYDNKELIIVYEDDDPATKEMVRLTRNKNIKAFEVPANPKLTLGRLRNLSIEKASGKYFCQWDDDDWYHNQRLEMQINCIRQSGKLASVMVNWLMYDATTKKAYFSFTKAWEGSILCKTDIITSDICYENKSQGEETNFIFGLVAKNYLYPLVMPALYIYTYHGNNTFNGGHFNQLFSNSQPLSPETSRIISDVVENKYTYQQACRLLLRPDFLKEIDYFNSFKHENILNEEMA